MVARNSNAATALRWSFGDDPARSLHKLADNIGVPRTLYELGVRETQLSTVIDQTTSSIAISPDDLRVLLHSALFGEDAVH
jgi:alcohol dehydrogenase class IV